MNEGNVNGNRYGGRVMASNGTVNNDIFRYEIMPSLQDLALVSIVTTVVKNRDCTAIMKYRLKEGMESNGIENPIYDIVSEIPLHRLLETKAREICKSIAWQMYQWFEGNSKCGCDFKIPLEYYDCISWTMDGTLNKPKTLRLMIGRNYSIDGVAQIFEMACHFCDEDLIVETWEQIPGDTRDHLYNLGGDVNSEFQRKCGLIKYWVFLLKDRLSEFLPHLVRDNPYGIFAVNHDVYEIMMKLSILDFNPYGVKYFWNDKLTEQQKKDNVSTWLENAFYGIKRYWIFLLNNECNDVTDIVFFLLSKQNDRNRQIEMLNLFIPTLIAPLMSTFPCQKFFEPAIEFIWDTLTEEIYYLVIRTILQLIGVRYTAKGVFIKLWNQSSRKLKKDFALKACRDPKLYIGGYCNLFEGKNVEILKIFLYYVNDEDKISCINSAVIEHDFATLILKDIDQLEVFDDIARNVFKSDSDIIEFRKHVIETIGYDVIRRWMYNDKWELMDQLLQWGFTSQADIDKYKADPKYALDTLTIVILFYPVQKYRRADIFLNWCYTSKTDIDKVKFDFACRSVFAFPNWVSFQEFIGWCFDSDKEVKEYKLFISQYKQLYNLLEPKVFSDYDYVDKILHWFTSGKKVKQFKRKFMLSEKGIIIIEKFVKDYDFLRFDEDQSEFLKFVEKLAKWYGPLGPKIVTRFRKRMRRMKRMVEDGNDLDLFAYLDLDEEKDVLFAMCDEFAKFLEKLNKSSN